MSRIRTCATAALLSLALTAQASAQALTEHSAFYFGLNAVVGGVSAFLRSLATPDPDPGAAFVKGALGGAVMYGGQRMVGTGRTELRLAGVQAVALGANIARNAGDEKPLLSDLTLPLYPFYLDLDPEPGTSPVRLSALATFSLVRAVTETNEFTGGIDWKETLLTGAPVFRSEESWVYPLGRYDAVACANGSYCDGAAAGMHRAGVTWYTTGTRGRDTSRRILAHEMIHLTQVVRDGVLHAVPLSDAALQRLGAPGNLLARFLILDLGLPISGLEAALPTDGLARHGGFYELEAITLSGSR